VLLRIQEVSHGAMVEMAVLAVNMIYQVLTFIMPEAAAVALEVLQQETLH
jgi:hypothetical protein